MQNVEKIFWIEFLEIYKNETALWKIKSPEYSNRILKNNSYEKLVKKLKEKYPEANRELAVRKINNFRTAYRKELKKVNASKRSGAGAELVYKPSLWYFEILKFLEDEKDCGSGRSTMDDDEEPFSPPKKRRKKNKEDEDQKDCDPGRSSMDYDEEPFYIQLSSPPKKRMKKNQEDDPIKLACEHLQAERMAQQNSMNGDDMLAKSWAFKLQEMEHRQRLMASKLISDIIFHGCMGNLTLFHTTEVPKLLEVRPATTPTSVFSSSSSSSSSSPQSKK